MYYYDSKCCSVSKGTIGPTVCEADLNRFTGKEPDGESGLDYFGARYFFEFREFR